MLTNDDPGEEIVFVGFLSRFLIFLAGGVTTGDDVIGRFCTTPTLLMGCLPNLDRVTPANRGTFGNRLHLAARIVTDRQKCNSPARGYNAL